jgi:L-alanine-DL-glutamate epimerase-like enolase superfamily enzyme
MTYVDDRTDEQHSTHTIIVVMTDRFMSGWGEAAGGSSYAGWACEPSDMQAVYRWVRSRSDALRVRVVHGHYRPSGCRHCHVYVVDADHPAIQGAIE